MQLTDKNNLKLLIMEKLNEMELPDDYPVHGGYLYVCDGKVITCDLMNGTVADLKKDLRSHYGFEAKSLTNCDIMGRHKNLKQAL